VTVVKVFTRPYLHRNDMRCVYEINVGSLLSTADRSVPVSPGVGAVQLVETCGFIRVSCQCADSWRHGGLTSSKQDSHCLYSFIESYLRPKSQCTLSRKGKFDISR